MKLVRRLSRWQLIVFGLLGALVASMMLVVLSVCVLVITGKGEHLWWVLFKRPLYRQAVQPKEVVSMPVPPPPDDHRVVRIGSVELACSAQFVASMTTTEKNAFGQGLLFETEGRDFFVSLPRDSTDEVRAYLEHARANVPEGYLQPILRMEAATYNASISEFRWSMSTDELQYLNWRLANNMLAPTVGDRAETLFGEDIDGILLVTETWAAFEWNTTDGTAAGMLIFGQESPPIDLSWVRPICASLKFTGEVYPKELSEETLEEILKQIEQ